MVHPCSTLFWPRRGSGVLVIHDRRRGPWLWSAYSTKCFRRPLVSALNLDDLTRFCYNSGWDVVAVLIPAD
jgi:hypothetical protein